MIKLKMKKKVKTILFIIIGLLLIISSFFTYCYIKSEKNEKELLLIKNKKIERDKLFQSNYSTHVITSKNSYLYKLNNKNKFIKSGLVSKNMDLELEEIDISKYNKDYIKLKNSDYYINYKNITKVEDYKESFKAHRYKNYIPFNENIVLKDNYKIYINEDTYYNLNEKISLPILVKENDKYYVEFDNKFAYIKKDDNYTIVEANNSNTTPTTHFAIINYHYIVDPNDDSCNTTLCHSFDQFDSHMKFLHDEGYFTLNMQELEWFMDKKVQLSKKTVTITVDDGWYAANVSQFLKKYNLNATLFLITSLTSKDGIETEYFDVHSHGHNIHNPWECDVPGTRGGGILCRNKDDLLNDLKTSREILNNTTVFCYPFYEYNDYAIETLKEAGFTMALAGGGRDVNQNDNKFKIPRYGITSYGTVDDLKRIVTVN